MSLPENMKNQVKKRIKAKVLKYWKNDLEKILKEPEKRLELYQNAWNIREKNQNFSAIPNAVILKLLIKTIGHWDKHTHKGAHDVPKDSSDNQGYHTIVSR